MALILSSGSRIVHSGPFKSRSLWEGKVFDWTPLLGPTWGYGMDSTGLHAPGALVNMAPETDWSLRPSITGSAGVPTFPGGWALKTASAGDDYIDWGANPNTSNMSQMTLLWYGLIVAHADNKRLICKGANAPTHTFGFRLITTGSAGGWGFEISYGTTDLRVHFDTSATERIAAGVPTVVVATWNGRTTASAAVKGYKNFLGPLTHFLDTNAAGSRVDDSTYPLRMGNHTDTTTFSPDAYHYRIAIWRRELVPAEIFTLAQHPMLDFPYSWDSSSGGGIRAKYAFGGIGGAGPAGAGDGWMGMSQMFKTGSMGSF